MTLKIAIETIQARLKKQLEEFPLGRFPGDDVSWDGPSNHPVYKSAQSAVFIERILKTTELNTFLQRTGKVVRFVEIDNEGSIRGSIGGSIGGSIWLSTDGHAPNFGLTIRSRSHLHDGKLTREGSAENFQEIWDHDELRSLIHAFASLSREDIVDLMISAL